MTPTSLYKEALIEGKQLREVATAEAKSAVLEALSPTIKKIIDNEINGTSARTTTAKGSKRQLQRPGVDSLIVEVVGTDEPTETLPTADQVVDQIGQPKPPIVATPTNNVMGVDTPVPGPDGKIIVDFDQLYQQAQTQDNAEADMVAAVGSTPVPPPESTVPSEPPVDVTTTPTQETQPTAVTTPSTTKPTQAASVPVLSSTTTKPEEPEEEQLPGSVGKIRENTTRLLASTLSVMEQQLSRIEEPGIKKILTSNMVRYETELTEAVQSGLVGAMQAKLLGMRISALHEQIIKNPSSYRRQQEVISTPMSRKTLREFATELFETHTADSAGYGDGKLVKPGVNKTLETADDAMKLSQPKVSDPEKMAEAAEAVDDETDMAALEEELKAMMNEMDQDEMEPVKLEADQASLLREKLKGLKEEQALLEKQLAECPMEPGSHADEPVNIHISVSGPASVTSSSEESLDSSDELSLSDDDEIEVVDDEEPSDVVAKGGDEDDDDELLSTLPKSSSDKTLVAENKALKQQLSEIELLTARSLYVNKLFANENHLTTEQKKQVVRYLDGAKTIAEAKEVYGKIKKVLSEASTASVRKLQESKSLSKGSNGSTVTNSATTVPLPIGLARVTLDTARLQQLAGIKPKRA